MEVLLIRPLLLPNLGKKPKSTTINQGPEQLEILQLLLQFQSRNANSSFIPYLEGSENTRCIQNGKPAVCPDITLQSAFES